MDDLVYHGSLVAFHKNQLDHRADDMPLSDVALYHLIKGDLAPHQQADPLYDWPEVPVAEDGMCFLNDNCTDKSVIGWVIV